MRRTTVALCAALVGSAAFGGGRFELVSDGVPAAGFDLQAVTNAVDQGRVRADVALFNRYLSEVSGASLPENPKGGNVIRIALKPIKELDRRFSWRIVFDSEREMTVEATTTSLFTALRRLLEDGCDARFLGVERSMFQFEPRRDVAVERRDRASALRSYTLLRNVFYLPGHARELGLDDDGLFKYSHGVPIYAFPKDRYNAEGWPSEIMPLRKDGRLKRPGNAFSGWQPCYSSPLAAAIATTNILDHLRSRRDVLSLTLGVNDNGGYCTCAKCKALDDGQRKSVFSNDPENHSASYYTFVNRVAQGIADEFPDVRLGLLAYQGTIMPPTFAVHRSVVPMMTFDTLAAGMDPEVRARQDRVIEEWGGKVPETGIWDYCWGRSYDLPRVDFAGRAQRLKFLHAHGGRAYFGENSRMADMLDGPKTYLTARLLEDIDADPDVILEEWFSRFAGQAARDELRRLYGDCEAYWRSEPMRRSPTYASREWIYMWPMPSHLFAVEPGFTRRLVERAKKVLSLARTDGERRRARILLCHFEYLDCVASFRGVAYGMPESGELKSARDAVRMLNELAERMDELMVEWKNAVGYLGNPDLEDKDVYRNRQLVRLDLRPLLAEQFGRASGFLSDPAVRNVVRRLGSLPHLPQEVSVLLKGVFEKSEEGLVADSVFRKSCGSETSDDVVYRGITTYSLTRNLRPGIWLVSAEVETPLSGSAVDFAVWRQVDGKDRDWEGAAWTPLDAGESRVFSRVIEVNDTEDGVNVYLRCRGIRLDDPVSIRNVRMICLDGNVVSRRTGIAKARRITARAVAVRETVLGADTIVCRRNDAHDFAHVVVGVKRILPDEKIVFRVKAASPESARLGALGAIIYESAEGAWKPRKNLLWNRRLSSRGFETIEFSATGKDLGRKSGDFLLIFFKMKDAGAVAISDLSWEIKKTPHAKADESVQGKAGAPLDGKISQLPFMFGNGNGCLCCDNA